MIEILEEQGVLLPEEEWGEHSLESTVARWPLAVAVLLATAALVVALVGGGHLPTWIALGGFLVLLFVIIWLCDRAVLRQEARTRGKRGAIRHQKKEG